jgi:hypothetical protein
LFRNNVAPIFRNTNPENSSASSSNWAIATRYAHLDGLYGKEF